MRHGLTQTANPHASSELGDLISRMADDVARDEARLREKLINLIEAGATDNAVELLVAWNSTAAGDLMTRIEKDSRG